MTTGFFILLQRASNEYFDMVIFMTFFILVSIICFILLLKVGFKVYLLFKLIFNQIWIVPTSSSTVDNSSLWKFDWIPLTLSMLNSEQSIFAEINSNHQGKQKFVWKSRGLKSLRANVIKCFSKGNKTLLQILNYWKIWNKILKIRIPLQ